jgi:hypothetical protein
VIEVARLDEPFRDFVVVPGLILMERWGYLRIADDLAVSVFPAFTCRRSGRS